MRILFEYDSILPPVTYGGTERILYWLMKALVKLGHEVIYLGPKESNLSSIGVTVIPKKKGEEWRHLVPKDIDIIHFSCTPGEIDIPFLVTIHGNGKEGETFHPNTVYVSKKHAANHGSDQFVYNALDLDEYPYHAPKKVDWREFLFLAKASWKVKNLKQCMSACKTAKKHLHVAGGRKFSLSRYHHFYGMVDQEKKRELLDRIDALLFPVRWHEPFGISIIEAMAYGKPVIGGPYGSLPELITPDTGVICKNYDELLGHLENKPRLADPATIRNYVETNFSAEVMAKNYLEKYERILAGELLNVEAPKTLSNHNFNELLPF